MMRKIIAQIVKTGALHLRLARLAMRARRINSVIMFHMIPAAEAEAFERVIRFLRDEFDVVPLDEIVEQARNPEDRGRGGLVALTFDDGYKNHCEVAYPILAKLSIPATFFVCPNLTERTVWTEELEIRLRSMDDGTRGRFLRLANGAVSAGDFVAWLKTIPVVERERIQAEIENHDPQFEFTHEQDHMFGLMTWDELKSLDANLITIGSHTLTHVDLPQASDVRLERELSESRRALENGLGRRVEHFCYKVEERL